MISRCWTLSSNGRHYFAHLISLNEGDILPSLLTTNLLKGQSSEIFSFVFFMNGLHLSPLLSIWLLFEFGFVFYEIFIILDWLSVIIYSGESDTPRIIYYGELRLCVFSAYRLWQRINDSAYRLWRGVTVDNGESFFKTSKDSPCL